MDFKPPPLFFTLSSVVVKLFFNDLLVVSERLDFTTVPHEALVLPSSIRCVPRKALGPNNFVIY